MWRAPCHPLRVCSCIRRPGWCLSNHVPTDGPYSLIGIVRDVEGVRHLAELGVVFLLFNIGLELSLERLRSMQKFVFGLGGLQVGCI